MSESGVIVRCMLSEKESLPSFPFSAEEINRAQFCEGGEGKRAMIYQARKEKPSQNRRCSGLMEISWGDVWRYLLGKFRSHYFSSLGIEEMV